MRHLENQLFNFLSFLPDDVDVERIQTLRASKHPEVSVTIVALSGKISCQFFLPDLMERLLIATSKNSSTHAFSKLDHFGAMVKIVYNNETV